jgi:hypothetical protein
MENLFSNLSDRRKIWLFEMPIARILFKAEWSPVIPKSVWDLFAGLTRRSTGVARDPMSIPTDYCDDDRTAGKNRPFRVL